MVEDNLSVAEAINNNGVTRCLLISRGWNSSPFLFDGDEDYPWRIDRLSDIFPHLDHMTKPRR